jgi:hypothetical protein
MEDRRWRGQAQWVSGIFFLILPPYTNIHRLDFNDALGSTSFTGTKDWRSMMPEWSSYAADAFGKSSSAPSHSVFIWRPAAGASNDGDDDLDSDAIQVSKKRKKNSPFHLEVGSKGRPLLPDFQDLSLDKKKAVIRAFISKHYSK